MFKVEGKIHITQEGEEREKETLTRRHASKENFVNHLNHM